MRPRPTPADFLAAAARLGAVPDGPAVATAASLVGPVTKRGHPAFLKVTNEPEERAGTRALERWNGNGAVRVLTGDGAAVLLERGGTTVREHVLDDHAATALLCTTIGRLHQQSPDDLTDFVSLRGWYDSLFADTTNRFDRARVITEDLLSHAGPAVLLHADLHHENVLQFSRDDGTDWLAIDPKGVAGPREFDYCNIFTNPAVEQALAHFDTRLAIVGRSAGIERPVLLRWIASWSALSGIWHLEDGDDEQAAFPHAIMDLALERLSG